MLWTISRNIWGKNEAPAYKYNELNQFTVPPEIQGSGIELVKLLLPRHSLETVVFSGVIQGDYLNRKDIALEVSCKDHSILFFKPENKTKRWVLGLIRFDSLGS